MSLKDRVDELLNDLAVESDYLKRKTKGYMGSIMLDAYDGVAVRMRKVIDEYDPRNIAVGLLASSGYLERTESSYQITGQGLMMVDACRGME